MRHYLGTPTILGEPSAVSPWEFPEICGEDLFLGLCMGLLRDPHKCHQEHVGDMSLDSQKDKARTMVDERMRDTSEDTHLYTGVLIGRMNEALLGSKYSGGAFSVTRLRQNPVKFKDYNACDVLFPRRSGGIFTFILVAEHYTPSPLLRDKLII